jgi:peptide/nickel transport system permease protein
MTWGTFSARTTWLERGGLLGLLAILLLALVGPLVLTVQPGVRVAPPFLPPSSLHWFGTDEIGRDLFARVLVGLRGTLLPTFLIIAAGTLVGTVLGVVAGVAGGTSDAVVQRLADLVLVLPAPLLVMAILASAGPSLFNLVVALALLWWPWYARIARDEVRRIIARPHFEAAQAAGLGRWRLISRHVAPGVLPSIVIAATLDVSNVVLAISMLSFLGLGQPAPAAELGAMTARTLSALPVQWWLPVIPAVAILLVCLCANLAGDGLRALAREA